mgnify:FL=1
MVGYYVLDPLDAYDINMKIEKHAYETYIKYLSYHPEDKRIAEIAEDELEHARELQHAMSMIVWQKQQPIISILKIDVFLKI